MLSLIVSCNKDITTDSTINCALGTSIIGKWTISKIEIGGRDTTSTLFAFFPCYKTMITEFKTDSTLVETNSGKDLLGQPCSLSYDKKWKLLNVNNKNYIIRYDNFTVDTAVVDSFGCNLLITSKDGIKITMNK